MGKPASSKVDMWAIGVLFYVYITGKVPFGGDLNCERRITEEHMERVREWAQVMEVDAIDLAFSLDLLAACTRVDPQARISSMQCEARLIGHLSVRTDSVEFLEELGTSKIKVE